MSSYNTQYDSGAHENGSLVDEVEHNADDYVVFSPESEVVSVTGYDGDGNTEMKTTIGAQMGDQLSDLHEQTADVDSNEVRLGVEAESQVDQGLEQRVFDGDVEIVEVVDEEFEPETPEVANERPPARFVAVDGDGQVVFDHMSLSTVERVAGETSELKTMTEKALRAKEVEDECEDVQEREQRCKDECEDMMFRQRTLWEDGDPVGVEVVAPDMEDEGHEGVDVARIDADVESGDPREELTQDELAAVNKTAAKLADRFGERTYTGRAGFAKALARKVNDGLDVTSAMFEALNTWEAFPHVEQSIGNIDPYYQHRTTVEVEILNTWMPNNGSQRQVGMCSDGEETAKWTVWHNSGSKKVLKAGDKVRFENIAVSPYHQNGELKVSFAVTADTDIHVQERSDTCLSEANVIQVHGEGDYEAPAFSADSESHAWLEQMDTEHEGEASVTPEETAVMNAFVRGTITYDEMDDLMNEVTWMAETGNLETWAEGLESEWLQDELQAISQ